MVDTLNQFALFIISALALLTGLLWIYTSFERRKHGQLIADTPTEDIESLSIGPSEVKGVAEPTSEHGVLTAPFSEEECLIKEWEIQEYDSKGKSTGWRTLGFGREFVPFYVDDGTSKLLVEPHKNTMYDIDKDAEPTLELGSEETIPRRIHRFLDRDDTPGLPEDRRLLDVALTHANGDRRYHQRLIKPSEEVYIFGTVQERKETTGPTNAENLVVRKESDVDREPMFLISDLKEDRLIAKRAFALLHIPFAAALAAAGAGGLALLYLRIQG